MSVDLHHICDTAPSCLCAGHPNDDDECCCQRAVDYLTTTTCLHCGEPMYAIDLDTGVRIDEMASAHGALQ